MTGAAVQTIWCELLVGTLADAGVTTCVVSPGSRSTPLVAALAATDRFALPTIIDERAAAFYALGQARATGELVALVCTSGSAPAHYYPALVEASMAGVPLVVLTSDRPPELQHCGASQTIDQVGMFGRFVRAAFDVGTPTASAPAVRALRRTVLQAIAAARGPVPGPVQLEVPLRKPLEPTAPSTDDERALADLARSLRGATRLPAPMLAADPVALAELGARIAAEPRGVIVAGAMPVGWHRAAALELARRTGYPLLAEASSQLRFGTRDGIAAIDRFDLVLAAELAPEPALVIRIGAEPVAAAWQGAFAAAEHWQLANEWLDPDSRARVIVGDVAGSLDALARDLARAAGPFAAAWLAAEQRAAAAIETAAAAHPRNEGDVLRAALGAMPPGALVQIGNSLPIRVVDLVCTWPASAVRSAASSANAERATAPQAVRSAASSANAERATAPHAVRSAASSANAERATAPHAVRSAASSANAERAAAPQAVRSAASSANAERAAAPQAVRSAIERRVVSQRGAAGIDGLVASAAGATAAGPVLLVLGDVSFAHDLGGLLATRHARAPLAIVVVDNAGGRIFGGLPVAAHASPAAFERHWLAAPAIDPVAIASALGITATRAESPSAVAAAVSTALTAPGVTVVHAPVAPTGARDLRATALATLRPS